MYVRLKRVILLKKLWKGENMTKRKLLGMAAVAAIAGIMGITALASKSDTCNLAGGGHIGIGSLTSDGGDAYTAKTFSNGCATRTALRVIDHCGEVAVSYDTGIVNGGTSKTLSYNDGTVGANSTHYLYRYSDSYRWAEAYCSVGR